MLTRHLLRARRSAVKTRPCAAPSSDAGVLGRAVSYKGKEKEQPQAPPSSRWYSSQAGEASTSANKLPNTLSSMMEHVIKDAPPTAADEFERLGLSAGLSRQITSTYPLITHPTLSQRHLIPAVLSPNDVLLRAHTGSGKSFGLLLALMAKPRIVFRKREGDVDNRGKPSSSTTGIASLVIVPSNELATQYLEWVRDLVPSNVGLDAIIQTLVRGDGQDEDERMRRLITSPPHILVATPTRALQVLRGGNSSNTTTSAGAATLGLPTLRTLVLDEVDSLLDLPGRFPSEKAVWRNMVHPPVGLQFLNEVMKLRGTHSGGTQMTYQGLEDKPGWSRRDYHAKEGRMRRSPNYTWLAPPKPVDAGRGEWPLQLVACSASANAVLRHFLGAKTGWARVGVRAPPQEGAGAAVRFGARRGVQGEERPVTGRWIDLTGLTATAERRGRHREGEQWGQQPQQRSQGQEERLAANTSLAGVMPQELTHHCLILDEADEGSGAALPVRNLPISRLRRVAAKEQRELQHQQQQMSTSPRTRANDSRAGTVRPLVRVVPPTAPAPHEVDYSLLEALALVYAQLGVTRGLAFIPPQWSLRTVLSTLAETYGVNALTVEEMRRQDRAGEDDDDGTPRLAVLQATSARGLDLPGVSHVFLVGQEAVGDTVRYVHLAGRAARLSATRQGGSTQRQAGVVVSLVRGLGSAEVKEMRERAASKVVEREGEELLGGGGGGGGMLPPPLMASSERKMWSMYQRLGIRCQRLKMGEWAVPEEEGEVEDGEAEGHEVEDGEAEGHEVEEEALQAGEDAQGRSVP